MGAFGALLIGFAAGFVIALGVMSIFSGNDVHEFVQLQGISLHSADEEFHRNEDVVARELSDKVRVLCIVFVSPKTLDKAKHIRKTWARRCNKLIFFSSVSNKDAGIIGLPTKNIKEWQWQRTQEGLKYVYKRRLDLVDWVLITDDKTYVVVENLRYLLSDQNSSDALFFGRRLSYPEYNYTLLSSDAGFVLSKEALRMLVQEGFPDESKCSHESDNLVDLDMGRCLERLGVRGVDTRDSLGRGRFFPFLPLAQLTSFNADEYSFWINSQQEQRGFNCCSDLAVSFHSFDVQDLYVMEYLVYHVRPHGIRHNTSVTLNRQSWAANSSKMSPQLIS